MTLALLDKSSLKPNSAFQNLYHVQKGKGSGLTAGLRKYNAHFKIKNVELLTQNKRAAATALKIVKFLLDLIICPILGTLALLGVAINAVHVRHHNRSYYSFANKNVQTPSSLFKTSKGFPKLGNETQTLTFDLNNDEKPAILAKINQAFKQATGKGLFITQVIASHPLNPVTQTLQSYMLQVKISNYAVENQFMVKQMLKLVDTFTKQNPNNLEGLKTLFST